jgi:hypothetical protein
MFRLDTRPISSSPWRSLRSATVFDGLTRQWLKAIKGFFLRLIPRKPPRASKS